jgi:hypothetical protein
MLSSPVALGPPSLVNSAMSMPALRDSCRGWQLADLLKALIEAFSSVVHRLRWAKVSGIFIFANLKAPADQLTGTDKLYVCFWPDKTPDGARSLTSSRSPTQSGRARMPLVQPLARTHANPMDLVLASSDCPSTIAPFRCNPSSTLYAPLPARYST